MTERSKLQASVPLIRPTQISEMIERIAALTMDAQALKLETLACFLEMCMTEAKVQAGGEHGDES